MCMFGGGGGGGYREPVKPQEAKMAEQAPTGAGVSESRKKMAQTGGAAASTLLTGPSGIENSYYNLGRGSTLLGA